MINPIDCCESADYFDELKARLKLLLEEKHIWKGTGILKSEVPVDEFLNNLFFYNALMFLKKYYK
jgi:hypothetical protein